jgi:cell division protein FtsL
MKYKLKNHPWWSKILFKRILNLTHYEKAPTDLNLDTDIELLRTYLKGAMPLLSHVINSKIKRFFKYHKKSAIKTILVVALVFCSSYLISTRVIQPQVEPKTSVVEVKIDKQANVVFIDKDIFIPPERAELNKENVDYFMSEFGIKYWYVVRQQILCESANFTSDVCLNGHNLFGMKLPGQRETTAIGEYKEHAKYKHWVYSLYDYKLWQEARFNAIPIKVNESYYDYLLKIKYAESPVYINALKNFNW